MSNLPVLLDVRTKEEWDLGHIKAAKLLSLDDLLSGNFTGLKQDDKIYIYCRTGSRSDLAKRVLIKNGFISVHNVGSLEDASVKFGEIVRGE